MSQLMEAQRYTHTAGDAVELAAEIKRQGWELVEPGQIAAMKKAGDYARWELASFHTAILRAGVDGKFRGTGFEIWRRRKPPVPLARG